MVRVSEEAGEAVEGVVAKLAKDAFETTEKDVGKDATKSGGKRAAKSAGKPRRRRPTRGNMDFTTRPIERMYQKNLEKNGGVHKCDYCGKQVYRRKSKSGIPASPTMRKSIMSTRSLAAAREPSTMLTSRAAGATGTSPPGHSRSGTMN